MLAKIANFLLAFALDLTSGEFWTQVSIGVVVAVVCAVGGGILTWLYKSYQRFVSIERIAKECLAELKAGKDRMDAHEKRLDRHEDRLDVHELDLARLKGRMEGTARVQPPPAAG